MIMRAYNRSPSPPTSRAISINKESVRLFRISSRRLWKDPSNDKRCNTPHSNRYGVPDARAHPCHNLDKNECHSYVPDSLKLSDFLLRTEKHFLKICHRNIRSHKDTKFFHSHNTHSLRVLLKRKYNTGRGSRGGSSDGNGPELLEVSLFCISLQVDNSQKRICISSFLGMSTA